MCRILKINKLKVMKMLKQPDGELVHNFIIKELVVRLLELDRNKLNTLKGYFVYNKLFEQLIKAQRVELLELKKDLAARNIVFQGSQQIDENISLYYFVQNGGEHEYRYSNIALRNHTYRELERVLMSI